MYSDKELIRKGKFQEALGDNYESLAIEIMIFKGPNKMGVYNRNLKDEKNEDVWCYNKEEAKELTKNIKLANDEWFVFWNTNSDWL